MNLNYHIGTFNTLNNNSIFTDSDKIDLFEGENIIYRGKLVDAENIEAIFNDLINTFTVPASPKNNRIFKNWFEIGVKNGFNPNLRIDSLIEYNSIQFRTGKTQLEATKDKDGKINSYSITFYGELTGLDDVFTLKDNEGNDLGEPAKLKDLDFSDYDFAYNKRNINALFVSPSLVLNKNLNRVPSLIMPFIVFSSKEIQYNTGTTTNNLDITKDEGRLFLEDFRPAIRQYAIIEAIEDKYDISFSRDFLDSQDFTTLYTSLNGNEEFGNIRNWDTLPSSELASPYLTFDDDKFKLKFTRDNLQEEVEAQGDTFQPNKVYTVTLSVKLRYENIDTGIEFDLRLIDSLNNDLRRTSTTTTSTQGTTSTLFVQKNMAGNSNDSFNQTYRLQIRSNSIIDFTGISNYEINYELACEVDDLPGEDTYFDIIPQTSGEEVNDYIYSPLFKVSENMPDVSILDYLKNIIKQYKLIIRPNSTTNFRLQNINDYYAEGNVIDITEYTEEKSLDSKVYKNNKKIEYKFEVQKDSITQEDFKNNTGRFRGDNTRNYNVDNKKTSNISFNTEIPFFTRLTDTVEDSLTNINIAIYSSLEKGEVESIYPKNMLSFYYNGITAVSNSDPALAIKIDLNNKPKEDEAATKVNTTDIIELKGLTICDSSNNYVFSQVSNNLDFSDTTINGWHQVNLLNNIYNKNHKAWIDNLLNSDARITSMDSILPPNLVNEIDLNSQIIYKNNKYSIEDFEIDLTTNESNFRLFPDFNNKFLVTGTTVSPTQINFNAGGGFSSITVRTDKDIESVSVDKEWITLGKISGNRRVFNVALFVNENYLVAQRNAIITLVIGGQTYLVNINQAIRVAVINNTELTISPSSRVLAQEGQNFTVNVQSNGFWTIGDLPEYITLLSDDLNFGNGIINLSINENNTEEQRVDSFIIFPLTEQLFRTFSFTQAEPPFIEVLTEDLDLSSGSQNFTVDVATNSDTTPNVTIGQGFITETSSSVINEGYRFTFTITENPSTTNNRDSLITFVIGNFSTGFMNDSLTVTQSDAEAFITVIPSNVNLDFNNTNYIYEVDSNVSWVVTKNVSWITLNTVNGNGDSNSVSITVNDNLGAQRQGIVTVRNNASNVQDTLVVNQSEYDQPNPPPAGRPQLVVTYLDSGDRMDISWLKSNPEYGTIANYILKKSVSFGTFTTVSTSPNLFFTDYDIVGGGQYRYLVVAVDNLGQESVDSAISLNTVVDRKVIVRPSSSNVPSTSGSNSIDVISNTAWGASGTNFLSISGGDQTGTGNKEIDYIYQANIGNSRVGLVIVEANVGSTSDTHNVSQAGFTPTLTLSPTSASFNEDNPNNFTVGVSSNSSWAVGSSPSWFNVSAGSGTGNGSFTIIPTTNNSGINRSFNLQVVANGNSGNNSITRTFNVSQIGTSESLTISPITKFTNANLETYSIAVLSNTSWTITENESWISRDIFSGNGNANVNITISKNTTSNDRVGQIVIATSELSRTHTVTQQGVDVSNLNEYIVSQEATATEACSINPTVSVWSASNNFGGSQILFGNAQGTTRVSAGFYSREGIFIQTDSGGNRINGDLCGF